MVILGQGNMVDAVNELVEEARLLEEGSVDIGENSEGTISLAEETRLLGEEVPTEGVQREKWDGQVIVVKMVLMDRMQGLVLDWFRTHTVGVRLRETHKGSKSTLVHRRGTQTTRLRKSTRTTTTLKNLDADADLGPELTDDHMDECSGGGAKRRMINS